ncbi:MAG: type V CRISPR-associated endonuclease Cas1 [Bacteroidaceae bacterium]|nr:type V CRISPR-associated endonuclease Cas1 [Bacteroidaceae bacterium]
MFTSKDVEYRSVYVINCIEDRELRVSSGELLLEDQQEHRILTKLPFQKILALFVVGHIHITTPLIEKCKKNNVALVVLKPSLRPVFYWSDSAEANFLVRKKQYSFDKNDISIARVIVENKIANHVKLLQATRRKDPLTLSVATACEQKIEQARNAQEYNTLMGVEGSAAKMFFSAYYQDFIWQGRKPRVKSDYLNATMDIGYTYLFNFIECFVRMFGFDLYVGIYHRLWFKRKSLVCDLMEPFRCIIDKTIRTAINRKQVTERDFEKHKGEYRLKREMNKKYSKLFFDALIPFKQDIFRYVQSYYRCFMGGKDIMYYPRFEI